MLNASNRKAHNTFIICFVCLILLFCITIPNSALGETITTNAIDEVGKIYKYIGDNRYWAYPNGGDSTSYMGSDKPGNDYYWGSNKQCAGFALTMGYLLTGCDPLEGGLWKHYYSLDAAGKLQVGDIVGFQYKGNKGTSTHMAMVYSVNGDRCKFVQASGGSNNKIIWNHAFWVNATDKDGTNLSYCSSGNTIKQLNDIKTGTYKNGIVVYRFTGTINIQYPKGYYTTKIPNLDTYYTIKGIIPSAENNPNNFSATDNLPYTIDWDVYGNRGSTEPFYYSPSTDSASVEKHTVQTFHAVELVQNAKGEEWLKLDDGTFILKSKMEEQYSNIEIPNGPGIYAVSEPNQTQWGYAPFDAHHNGFDLKNGTEIYVARAVRNNKGSLWFEIDSVGSNKWVYSGHLTFKETVVSISFKTQENNILTALPVTSGTGIPTGKLNKGSGFGLRGTIIASENITSAVATVTDLNKGGNALPQVSYAPNNKTINIQNSKINNDLKFGQLNDGAYEYKVVVTTESGAKATVIDSTFTIGSGIMPDDPGPLGDMVNRIPGDANEDGEVDIVDAMLIARWYCGYNLTINESNSDVNQDGEVDVVDAMLIARWYCGYAVTLN